MIWSAEYTKDGCLIGWRGVLPEGTHVGFHAGLTESALALRFSGTGTPGWDTIDCISLDYPHPGAVGRLDILDADDNLVEEGRVLPLIPGLRRQDILYLRKLAQDHRTKSSALGVDAYLYRPTSDGTPCPTCRDPVSGAQLKSSCPTCDGAGVLQSWVGPFRMRAQFLQHRTQAAAPSGAGTLHEAYGDAVRLDAFPRPKTNDRLWVPGTERVYLLGDQQRTVAGVAGVPAVVECSARLPHTNAPEAAIPEAWFADL